MNYMNQNLTTKPSNFPSLFHIAGGNSGLAMPFAREIFLLDCYIAGTNFRPNLAEIEPNLEIGAEFRLQREVDNEFDERAIAVYDAENNKLGYVPKMKNEVLTRLLDAGKLLSAKLTAKEWNDSWLKLNIEIFLHD